MVLKIMGSNFQHYLVVRRPGKKFQHPRCTDFKVGIFWIRTIVPHLLIFQCLGKATLHDCGLPWVTSFIFLMILKDGNMTKSVYKVTITRNYSNVFFVNCLQSSPF